MSQVPPTTRDLLSFIDASPTPFHAVESARERLESAGFTRLRESDSWPLAPGDRRYVVRNGSTLAAFVVGGGSPAEVGFAITGAHTDSPNLRLKPVCDFERAGYAQASIEVYGGVLLNSWLDRDLGLAGRVMLQGARGPESRLYRSARAIGRIPQLAIHLDREVNERGLILNKELHLAPVLGLSAAAAPDAQAVSSALLSWLAGEFSVRPADIVAHDLMFFDFAPSIVSGLAEEFIHAPRLDNLASCHAGLTALTRTCGEAVDATRMVVLYDNEEIGSATLQGAAGPFLEELLARIVLARGGDGDSNARARARSFFLSTDMAHAVHPNYADKHETRHQPRMNGGPVIKFNVNARYATDAETSAEFQALCRDAEVPVQRFAMRADLPCGSTIGPLVSTRLGLKTVDVGNPMLAMHSCREMGGAHDPELMVRALAQLFRRKGPAWPR